MFNFSKIIGLKVVAVKATRGSREPSYILFDDKKTYIYLDEQDYYTYHDCNSCARRIDICQIESEWDSIMWNLPDADQDI